jgi:hypothetical protein
MSAFKPLQHHRLLWCCIMVFILGSSILLAKDDPLIRNYLRVKAILKEESPIYEKPSDHSKQVDKAKQYSIVFVFNPDGGKKYIKDGFYRVGKAPDEALGWIPKEMLREWDHRLCLHFTPIVGRQPALVYEKKKDADRVLRADKPERDKAVAEEPGDLSRNRYSMLLPVLDDLNITTGGQVKRSYQVGYLAGGESAPKAVPPTRLPEGSTPPGGSGEIATLELMFVMDSTGSMHPYIEGAKRVIGAISNRVRSMREAGTRIGLLCYQDYNDSHYVTKTYSALTRDHTEVINVLENEITVENGIGGDMPEAVFDGLHTAITETDWDIQKSSLRVVILVGDASGHPSGDAQNPMNYALDQMVKTASDNRVRIIAVKIRSKNEPDNVIHREQMQKLGQGQNEGDSGFYREIEITPDMTEEYIKELTASIESEIARMGRLIDVVKNPDAVIPTLSSADKAIILKNLKSRKKGASHVTFSEGWLNERDEKGTPQVKPYVFMSFDDLALNVFYLQTAMTLATSPTETVQKSVAELVKTQTGEAWQEGESLADHYQKKFGLPTTSKLLRFSLKEIGTWGEQRRKDLVEAIKSKVKLMETHRDNPESWYKLGKKDYRYTFVPLEHLP